VSGGIASRLRLFSPHAAMPSSEKWKWNWVRRPAATPDNARGRQSRQTGRPGRPNERVWPTVLECLPGDATIPGPAVCLSVPARARDLTLICHWLSAIRF